MGGAAGPGSIGDLYSRNFPWMLRRALRSLGSMDAAQDVVQDSFARTLPKIEAGVVRNAEAYLSRALSNAIAGHLRKAHRELILDLASLDASQVEGREDVYPVELAERRQLVTEAMLTLRPRQRRALGLLSEGLTASEIAGELNTTSHVIGSLLVRAKANLKRELLRRGLVPVILPLWWQRLKLRLHSAVAQLSGSGLEAILAPAVALLVGLILTVTFRPSAPSSNVPVSIPETLRSLPNDQPAVTVAGRFPQPPLPRGNPAGSPARQVATVPVGAGGVEIAEGDDGGKEEPPVHEQILAFLQDPAAWLPECHGVIECPRL